MTVGCAVRLNDGRVYCATDSAIGYASGYRRAMPTGKWWEYDGFLILESGSDFALSRIRRVFEAKTEETSVELLQDCVHEVAEKVASKFEGVGDLEAELLYADPDLDGLYVIGGDGGIVGPDDWACIGHGAPLLTVALEMGLPVPSRRTLRKVHEVVMRGLTITARGADSVHDPFYRKVVGGE